MLQITYTQLFVLIIAYTILMGLALIIGIDLGSKLANSKKPIKNFIPDITLPVELQPKSIYEIEENENQFLR